jgi:hypothetical protein
LVVVHFTVSQWYKNIISLIKSNNVQVREYEKTIEILAIIDSGCINCVRSEFLHPERNFRYKFKL